MQPAAVYEEVGAGDRQSKSEKGIAAYNALRRCNQAPILGGMTRLDRVGSLAKHPFGFRRHADIGVSFSLGPMEHRYWP